MATFSPNDGVNEREPTLISDGSLQDTDGAEYRVGQAGLFVARGREQIGTVENLQSTAPVGLAPDGLTVNPYIWFRADDMTGEADGNNTAERALPEKTGNFPNGWVVVGGGTEGVDYNSPSGASNINGHAWVGQASTPTKLALSGQGAEDSTVQFNSDFTFFCVYRPRTDTGDTNASWILGRKNVAGDVQGIGAPIRSVNGRAFFYTATSDDMIPSSGPFVGTSSSDVKILIVRRSGTAVTALGTDVNGDKVEFGSITNGGQVTLNGLFRAKDGTVAEDGLGTPEFAAYKSYITDDEATQLYQWAADRFGITLPTTGATTSDVTGRGLYEAGFDASAGFLIAHEGNSLHVAANAAALTFTALDDLPSGSSAIVGTHYANRHYLATGKSNRKIEQSGTGVTSFPVGMSTSTFTIGVSVTQGVSDMTATIGLAYWATEYDSARGIESRMGSTAHTGIFSLKDSVIVTVTGTSANARADKIRWYRSTDGGGYPDGGLIETTAIGTTQITDKNKSTASMTVPQYGIISLGGLDTDRDEPPPVMSVIFGPYQDSMLGVSVDEPRVLRFTPAGYPDSWPSGYGIPIETARRDEIVTGVVLSGRIGAFCNDSVHVIYRLPRDSDSIFAAGESQEPVTDERGCMSRRGATTFTPPGSSKLAAWVARDGIWGTNLASSPVPLTDKTDWESRVDVPQLVTCRLLNDSLNRRLVFIYRRPSDTTHNTGIWYLDYQEFQARGMRITFADHGPLADAVTMRTADGLRRVVSFDSRSASGKVYIESNQDIDESLLRDSSGSVRFRARTKEFLPAGPRGAVSLGKATWMHDAGPEKILHRFFFNRRDDNPEIEHLTDPDKRTASHVGLQRQVNSVSLEIESTGTRSYGTHWIDVEGLNVGPLGGREGA